MRQRSKGRFIYSLFVLAALCLSTLIAPKNPTVFLAFSTLGWHALANLFCGRIASYRFKNPAAKYVEIKNKAAGKLLVHPVSVDGVDFASGSDARTNILGLVLNIINTVLFVSFEILLFMPEIPCASYDFGLYLPKVHLGFKTYTIELHSFNEIIPAEGSRAFALATGLIFVVFLILFERQLKEHRKKIERNTAKTPRRKPLKKTKWYYPLYTSLIDVSACQSNKKHKFRYNPAQLKEIEDLVHSAAENAELKLKRKGDKLVSFKVIDTLNDHIVFTGLFI